MLDTVNNKQAVKCSINLTPKATNDALSKMKMPKIPDIAVNALNILNHASYSHLQNTHTR
jgi:hypothetical protein